MPEQPADLQRSRWLYATGADVLAATQSGAGQMASAEMRNLPASQQSVIAAAGSARSNREKAVTGAAIDASVEDTMLSMAGELQKPLPAQEVILIGLLAAAVVLVRALWEIAGPFETVVHESAHVLAGILAGRTIRGVRIEEAGGGSTDMVPKSGCGYGVAAFVGYIGPSAAGLIAAGLITTGRMYAVLWLGLVLLAVMLVTIRNFFGLLVILTCGALLYIVVRYGTAGVETAFAYFVAWFLLISGTRLALRAAGRPKKVADAEILAGMTFLFRWMWCLLWLAGTIAALLLGGKILIRGGL